MLLVPDGTCKEKWNIPYVLEFACGLDRYTYNIIITLFTCAYIKLVVEAVSVILSIRFV